ncbi:MAG: zinc-ribbon and DUF3426 domain-containing protein [Pseudomonadota bacterium]|nr:zinc-ribbon and DUF3426 domain-containing protein [Pseudomonadota bacterium]
MFTQCPKCQSVFMVSDKDIKAHEGLVRCGNCYSVFNSSWNLTDDPRKDFIEPPASSSTNNDASLTGSPASGSTGSGFTFSIVEQAVDTAATSASDVEQPAEGGREDQGEIAHLQDSDAGASNDLTPDTELEPFPEPDDFHDTSSEHEKNENAESLLYFDTNEEDAEESEREISPIEDLTILQTPSFTDEIPSLDQDASTPGSEFNDEPVMGSLSEESMWPGGEADFENNDETDLSAMPEDASAVEISENYVEENLPVFSDDEAASILAESFKVDEPAGSESVTGEAEEYTLLEGEPEAENERTDDVLLGDEDDAWAAASVAEAEVSEGLPVHEGEDGEISPEQLQEPGKSAVADDILTVTGKAEDADEFFSIESLPKTADEAFPQDSEAENPDESVFITSEEEEIDEAYVPISLKDGEENEVFNSLDDFPEPGELSAMNYEDTMEINAMLEEANISKEQIESALSAAAVGDEEEEEKGHTEEISLSSDAGIDLADALFAADEDEEPSTESTDNEIAKPAGGFFKKLISPGLGRKKAWKEPAIADDQTQLIQSLNRGRNQSELPVWVGKYSLIAAVGVMIIALLGQIGYFYMDKLVRITPLRPVLDAGCMIAGCTVPEIQNIGEIEQLSSRLTPLTGRDGGFKVSSILINRDIRSQAFPVLELTLTDRAGNMISRRVVTQDNYLAKEAPMMMKPNDAADINIRFRTPSIRVDGFELRPISQNWQERSKQAD